MCACLYVYLCVFEHLTVCVCVFDMSFRHEETQLCMFVCLWMLVCVCLLDFQQTQLCMFVLLSVCFYLVNFCIYCLVYVWRYIVIQKFHVTILICTLWILFMHAFIFVFNAIKNNVLCDGRYIIDLCNMSMTNSFV